PLDGGGHGEGGEEYERERRAVGAESQRPGGQRGACVCRAGRSYDRCGGTLREARVSEALKRAIAASPPGTLFTREGLLEGLAREEAAEPRPLEWLDLKAAAAILGTDERKLRRMCARWERERAAGRKPKVRVRRRGMAPSSPWLLCEDDVWALRRERGPVRIVDPVEAKDI